MSIEDRDDLVGDVADAITLDQKVQWERCARPHRATRAHGAGRRGEARRGVQRGVPPFLVVAISQRVRIPPGNCRSIR